MANKTPFTVYMTKDDLETYIQNMPKEKTESVIEIRLDKELEECIEQMSDGEINAYIERVENASTEELEELAYLLFYSDHIAIDRIKHYKSNFKFWEKFINAFSNNYNISERLFHRVCILWGYMLEIMEEESKYAYLQKLKIIMQNVWDNRNNYKLIKDELPCNILSNMPEADATLKGIIIDVASTSDKYEEILCLAKMKGLRSLKEGKQIIEILWESCVQLYD